MEDTRTDREEKFTLNADGVTYEYTIKRYELTNILGNVVTILQKYKLTNCVDQSVYSLYKTREGNWYEITEHISASESYVLRILKLAVDENEATAK